MTPTLIELGGLITWTLFVIEIGFGRATGDGGDETSSSTLLEVRRRQYADPTTPVTVPAKYTKMRITKVSVRYPRSSLVI